MKQEINSTSTSLGLNRKGCSGAVTSVVETNPGSIIRKLVYNDSLEKLKQQYNWLQKYQHLKHFPKIKNVCDEKDFFYFDMDYLPQFSSFFDYILKDRNLSKSKEIFASILSYLDQNIYAQAKFNKDRKLFYEYIEQKVFEKVRLCEYLIPEIQEVLQYPRLKINGGNYLNLYQIIDKILSDQTMVDNLSQIRESDIHGDLTVENILVYEDQFLIIDPNPGNIISDRILDFGKVYQSLHSGYEFLNTSLLREHNKNQIIFNLEIDHSYRCLKEFMDGQLRQIETKERILQVLFHEAVHFARMLPYKAKQNPDCVLIFYATMVMRFNDFYFSWMKR